VLGQHRREARVAEGVVQFRQASRRRSGARAVGHVLEVADAQDVAVLVDGGLHLHHAAQHPIRPEALVQRVQVPHSVEERHDHRVRSDGRREVLDRTVQAGRLHRHQDRVVRLGDLPRDQDPRPDRGVLAAAVHAQPPLAEDLRPARAHQERHVPAGGRQPRPEQPAGSSRPDNQDPHAAPLS
jgi:hypothetical protein